MRTLKTFESFAGNEDLADFTDREKVLSVVQSEIDNGTIVDFQADEDKIQSVMKELGIDLSKEDLEWVMFVTKEGGDSRGEVKTLASKPFASNESMRNVQQFDEFFLLEFVKPNRKDIARINTLNDRAKDDDHLLRLAVNMANAIGRNMEPGSEKAIKAADKAESRGNAAEDENFHDMAGVFFDRAKVLRG